MSDLSECVYACVGASCCVDVDFFLTKLEECLFDTLLYGGSIVLSLPSDEWCSVVLYEDFPSCHCRIVPGLSEGIPCRAFCALTILRLGCWMDKSWTIPCEHATLNWLSRSVPGVLWCTVLGYARQLWTLIRSLLK